MVNRRTQPTDKFEIEDQKAPPSRHLQRIRIVLEAIGLSILYNLLCKIFKLDVEEQKKIVMDRNKGIAAVRSLIHIIPAGVCISLVYLNLINRYLGSELPGQEDQDPEKLAALQFAAKLHELLMLSSLGVVLVTHIRKELTFGDGIPFGALFSGQEFHNISILWSLELWGAVYQKWRKKKKKGFILSLIIVCSVLGLSVGPSSANLMRPRLAYWPAGGTPFWINTAGSTLFPATISNSSSLSHCMLPNDDIACPSSHWQVLNDNIFSNLSYQTGFYKTPDKFNILDSLATRTLAIRSRSNHAKHLWDKMTFATIPFSFVADSICRLATLWTAAVDMTNGNLLYRLETSFAVNAYQPVVIVRCIGNPIVENSKNSILPYKFAVMDSTLSKFNGTLDAIPDLSSSVEYQLSDNDTLASIGSALLPGSLPSLHWLDLPDLLTKTKSSLNAVAVVPKVANFDPSYFCCSIEIPLPNATANGDASTVQQVYGSPPHWLERTRYSSDVPLIYPSADWAEYVSAPIVSNASLNSTVFSSMVSTAAQWDYQSSGMTQYPEISVEIILASLLINGIGRQNYNASILLHGYLQTNPSDNPPWTSKILPKNLNLGPGDNIFDIPLSLQAQSTMLELQVTNYGYAYSYSGATQKAAIIVLLSYTLLVLLHSLLTIWNGWSSNSWGSSSEIAALAINSPNYDGMRNTGAGVHTISVFEKNVQVDVEQGNLQMIFEVTKKSNQVEANIPYG